MHPGDRLRDEEPGDDSWLGILRSVRDKSASVIPDWSTNILVLGDARSGKASLIGQLCAAAGMAKKPIKCRRNNLNFVAVDVQLENTDTEIKCNCWVLSSTKLIPVLVDRQAFDFRPTNTVIVLVVDCSKPWAIYESVTRWLDFVSKLECALAAGGGGGEKLRVTVVCTKTDLLPELERNRTVTEEKLEYIQHALRRKCLQHRHGLAYSSIRDLAVAKLIYRNSIEKLYNLPDETNEAVFVDRDLLFIPPEWDSELRIDTFFSHAQLDASVFSEFPSIVTAPNTTNYFAIKSSGLQSTPDEQKFLKSVQAVLAAPPPNTHTGGGGGASPLLRPDTAARIADIRNRKASEAVRGSSPMTVIPPSRRASADKLPPNATLPRDVSLHQFFDGLINKKPSTVAPPSLTLTPTPEHPPPSPTANGPASTESN